MRLKMVVTGGGSGGHIYPALAIIDSVNRRVSDLDVLYIGTEHGLERELVSRRGIPFAAIHARGFLVRGLGAKIWGVAAAFRGLWEAFVILRRYRPAVVVGTGGYVSGPVGLAAVILHIPLVIQEQNVWPGLTNRKLASKASRVLVPFDEAQKNFPDGTVLAVVPNPVVIGVRDSKEQVRQELGVAPGTVVVLATGGSQGAKALNQFLLSWLPILMEHPNWGIFWMTGKRYHQEIQAVLDGMAVDSKRVWVVEYFYDIQKYLKAADVFFGRSGAMSLADCAAFGLPAILVPSPNVSEDHQTKNAQLIVKREAGYMVSEASLARQGPELLEKLLTDAPLRARMSQNALAMHDPDAERKMVDAILASARGRGE